MNAFEANTQVGVFIGYRIHLGGKWADDYLVVEFAALQENPNAKPSE